MKIQYFANLRDCTHTSQEEYSAPAPNVAVLLNDLCRKYGQEFRKWVLTPEGDLCNIAIILVNGRDVRDGSCLKTPLSPQDVVCIFPPVAGGSD